MQLGKAKMIALGLEEALRPYCEQVSVAGSVRREKPEVKDIEIVYRTKYREQQWGFWDVEHIPLIDEAIAALIDRSILTWDEVVKRQGQKYKRLIHCASGMVIELFGAAEDNWGLIYAIRTGPGAFNQLLVSQWHYGGGMPRGMRMEGGHLTYLGQVVPTPTERIYFQALDLPWVEPKDRSDLWLKAWLSEKGHCGREAVGARAILADLT